MDYSCFTYNEGLALSPAWTVLDEMPKLPTPATVGIAARDARMRQRSRLASAKGIYSNLEDNSERIACFYIYERANGFCGLIVSSNAVGKPLIWLHCFRRFGIQELFCHSVGFICQ